MKMPGRTRTIRGTTFGGFAFAALLVAALSGFALALPFDAHKPYESLALILLTNPGARFYRNVHYFAAQLFLLLTVLHAWDHLRRSTERRLSSGMWIRVTLTLPLAAFLLLSGFMLKGDPEATQAARILSSSVAGIPLIGRFTAVLLFGPGPESAQVLYVHHAATATILTWLFVAEHARVVWPKRLPVVAMALGVTAVGLFFSPVLHDGLDPLVRGPWYFLGLQELLHWTAQATWLVAIAALALLLTVALPLMNDAWARRGKVALAAGLAAYVFVTAFAILFRGENWELVWPRAAQTAGIAWQPAFAVAPVDVISARPIPTVLGRPEGCLSCHNATHGLSASHRPDAVGCASCHGGDPFSLDRGLAHRRLILVPGNLDVAARTCGLAQCHPTIVERVQHSIMATMAGIVGVDRDVFGERGGTPSVRGIRHSSADTHLRQLCASCHLDQPKTVLGPVGESSRGGGCNACHLKYSRPAGDELAKYERNRRAGTGQLSPNVHPDLSIDIGDEHCFGCHSRSGRISTSYEGWMEQEPSSAGRRFGPAAAPGSGVAEELRRLDDGRWFVHVSADIHFEKGMRCVDCHTAREVMGDGTAHARKSEQLRIGCEDCHATGRPMVARAEAVDAESQRILRLRDRLRPGNRLLVSSRGDALVNTTVGASGEPRLIATGTNEVLPLKRPSSACTAGGGHARLSCGSCHTAWAPRCSQCHTRFDPRATAYDHVAGLDVNGAWIEEGRDYRAEPPTLGVRTVAAGRGASSEVVDTFVPGMILTIDRETRGRPDVSFKRLYARISPHTIARGSRSCESCHNDPVAIGYGHGNLTFERSATSGRWVFAPEREVVAFDRLPADAWTGFLQTRREAASTRPDVRPFTADEQKRILTVGACLTCHRGDSVVMRDAIADFRAVRARMTKRCVAPTWE